MKTTLTVCLGIFLGIIHQAVGAQQVTIVSPTNGTVLSPPASISIRTAISGGGKPRQVEFFINGVSRAVDTKKPYRLDVTGLAAGSYTLTAVLTDTVGGKSTNSVTITVNERPGISITAPTNGAVFLAPATFSLAATASDSNGSVARIQFFRGGTSIGIATTNPASVLVTDLPPGTYRFTAQATDNLGAQSVSGVDLVVKTRPTVTFVTPAANAHLTAVTNLFEGTANDTRGLSAVQYSLNGAAFQAATGLSNWNTSLVLLPGTNVVRVRAVDNFGNYSLTNTRSFFQVVTSLLTLIVSGNGTVSGATNGQALEIYRAYRLTARPAPGHAFSNWTGQVSGSLPSLDFLMQSNLVVQANFVPNPIVKVVGTYHGLIYETSSVKQATSGDFRLKLAASGRYSAVIRLAGKRYSTRGLLNLEGKATNQITRRGTNALMITWAVDLHGLDEVLGSVSDGQWVSTLQGDRMIFHSRTNPAPLAGRYTVSLPGSDQAGLPEGHGWATLRMTTAGWAIFAGCLGDGTRVVTRAPVSKNRIWPLYAPLYRLQGSILGWIQFDWTGVDDDLYGDIDWFKPAQPTGVYYPAGFSCPTTVTGSRYVPPASSTVPVLALTNAVLALKGGNLSQPWTNSIVLGPGNRITNAGPNVLAVSVTLGTGRFKGRFVDPTSERPAAFTGVLLQKSVDGVGCFLGTNASGQVWIEARP